VPPLEQAVESSEAGVKAKDVVGPSTELVTPTWCRAGAVVFQIGIELPDQRADALLGDTLLVSERLQFVHQALGVDPTQRMLERRNRQPISTIDAANSGA
jgi:hypothetical protein